MLQLNESSGTRGLVGDSLFWDKPDKTDLEYVLLGFGIVGFVADTWWTIAKT